MVSKSMVSGKSVLDIGSRDWFMENPADVSIHDYIESLTPGEYVGIDLKPGKFVDIVMDAKNVVAEFGENRFDLILCLEVLEHEKDWKSLITESKKALANGGYFVLTTRLPGYPFHGFPDDFWRFTKDVFEDAFSDLEIITLLEDTEDKGIYLLAQKPNTFKEPKDLFLLAAPEVSL